MGPDTSSLEAAVTQINWIGNWGRADFDGQLRGDALMWSADEVRRYVASSGRELPAEEIVDSEDSPCPHTGAGASRPAADIAPPWWVEAQCHTEGPSDAESLPRRIEGWWRVITYRKDRYSEVGADLQPGELCFIEKMWSDRIRVFRTGEPQEPPLNAVPLERVCDLQLMKQCGAAVGCRWALLRDNGEAGDDPDEIRVGQERVILGGEFGNKSLRGMPCKVKSYVPFMDRWTVEVPVKDQHGKNMSLALVPAQLQGVRLPRDPKPNGSVNLELALANKALELRFADADLTDPFGGSEEDAADAGPDARTVALAGSLFDFLGHSPGPQVGSDGGFRLRLQFVSRVRPGGRVWTASEDSMYKYVEMRYIASGLHGAVFRVLRMVDPSKRSLDDTEDPHAVLDLPRGSDHTAVTKAYRKLARRWHPDKVPAEEREHAVSEFRRIHQAYENLLADPERSSDLLVLKMQHPVAAGAQCRITAAMSFRTEAKCLSLVSQLRLANVAKLAEVGPNEEYIVTWPYLPEALIPSNESDGLSQVDRVDLVRQGWSDYSRSRRAGQKVIQAMMALIRHDLMMVDPLKNIIVDRESGEPLFIDFGRGETAGSIYTTRISTFMKKVFDLLSRSVTHSTFDIASRYIRDIEDVLFAELERWQDEKTRDQKKALAMVGVSTKWQEGISQCRDIWESHEENPFRKIFKDHPGVCPLARKLRDPTPAEDSSDEEAALPAEQPSAEQEDVDDDPDGLCDADIDSLTPLQRVLRAKKKKGRRAKLPQEKPTLRIKVEETLADGTLGLGLDDADEDHRGLVVVQVHKQAQRYGWELADRIVSVNGRSIDDWDDFRMVWSAAKSLGGCVVFGVVREGVEAPPEPDVPSCLHCGSQGKHLQKCTTWKHMPEGKDCVYFCGRDCQREAWRAAKRSAAPAA